MDSLCGEGRIAVGGCSGKSKLRGPKRSRLQAHRQHGSLLEAIEEGVVPRPGLLTYQDWNSWRAREGQRPSKRRHGDDARTTATGDEAQLWRTVIKGLVRPGIERPVGYGWGCLARARGRRREGSREGHRKAGFDRPNGEPPATGPARSVASSTVGGESVFRDMSLVRLQEVFLKDYTPGSEAAVRFAKKLRRVSEALGLFGEEVDEALVERWVIRALYLEKIYGTDEERQLALLKEFFQELVLDEPPQEQEQEHERRVSILLEIIHKKEAS